MEFDFKRHNMLVASGSFGTSSLLPKFPWEEGWVASVLSDADPLACVWAESPVAAVLPPLVDDGIEEVPCQSMTPAPKRPRISTEFAGWTDKANRDRARELRCWLDMLLPVAERSTIAGQLKQMSVEGSLPHDMVAYLDVIVSEKALNTLRRHRQALSQLVEDGLSLFPADEAVVFDFLLRTSRGSSTPSRGVGVFKALLFAQHVFEFTDLATVTGSRRVRSAVTACTKQCATPWPRSPLPVKVVEDLEWLVVDGGAELQLRLMAGLMLVCVYTRSRWMEVQGAKEIIRDEVDSEHGFLELVVTKTKVTKAELRGRSRLSLTAPSHGVTGVSWASCWLQLRDGLGLPQGDECPLLPVPLADGQWGSRPITTAEGTSWLRFFVKRSVEAPDLRGFSTHSCKATTLSWACKYGLSDATRAMLGYHRSSLSRMVDLYGRDHQAPALRELAGLLKSIRDKVFFPDRTRSGRFSVAIEEAAIESQDESDTAAALVEQECDSSASEIEEEACKKVNPELVEGGTVKHVRFGTVHRLGDCNRSIVRTTCGVTVGDQFVAYDALDAELWCQRCYR
eukprot:6492611-Amphidinium_carterae.1